MPRPVIQDVAAIRAALGLPPANHDAGRRVAYGRHASQYGELFMPSDAGKLAVVVVVHGGAWRQKYDLALGAPLAADLAEHGVAAWNIEYRRVGGGGGWPNSFRDVAAAVDALAGPVQAEAGGRLDLSRVVAVGHSSGGQLASWLATRHRLPGRAPGSSPRVRLKGVVSQNGVLDLAEASQQGLVVGAIDDFMGGSWIERADRYALASPMALLPAGVPVICVHGDADQTVPIRQSQRYVEAATAAGDAAQLVALPGAGHFEVIDPTNAAWHLCRDAALGLANG